MPRYGLPVEREMGCVDARTQSARQGTVPCSKRAMILSVTISKTVAPLFPELPAELRGGAGMSPAWRGAGAGTGPGGTGYALYWQLTKLGVDCEVIAPSL